MKTLDERAAHMAALHARLINEVRRLAQARTHAGKKARRVIVRGIEREIDRERGFCYLPEPSQCTPFAEDELLAELFK